MKRLCQLVWVAIALVTSPALATGQRTNDPFPKPIPLARDVVIADITEFTEIPDSDGRPARMMELADVSTMGRMFLSDMRGVLYSISYDGKSVTKYLDLRDTVWKLNVESTGPEQGLLGFAFHPQFGQPGTVGYGKFYTMQDTTNRSPSPDFKSGTEYFNTSVLLEWTAKVHQSRVYDGDKPRILISIEEPFNNHHGGQIAFRPAAIPGDSDFGLLYMGMGDGGSGGDPLSHGQNLNSFLGKLLRIDPLGSSSRSGKYGIPASNPFADGGKENTLGEIYAYGLRHPQRFTWDSKTQKMFVADIGGGMIEEIDEVTRGANLGWNAWEGSFAYGGRRQGVKLGNQRGDPRVTYPIVEYDHSNPMLLKQVAITGLHVYRRGPISQLKDLMLFGDIPSGEIFYISANRLPKGGQDAIRRVLFRFEGNTTNLLELIRDKNTRVGRSRALRADVRLGTGPENRLFLLNKQDGTIRELIPAR